MHFLQERRTFHEIARKLLFACLKVQSARDPAKDVRDLLRHTVRNASTKVPRNRCSKKRMPSWRKLVGDPEKNLFLVRGYLFRTRARMQRAAASRRRSARGHRESRHATEGAKKGERAAENVGSGEVRGRRSREGRSTGRLCSLDRRSWRSRRSCRSRSGTSRSKR